MNQQNRYSKEFKEEAVNLVMKIFNFLKTTLSAKKKRCVFSRPALHFDHSFFRSNARHRKYSSVEIFVLPRVRKLLNLRLFFKTQKAPST
jgi:hypothetical protein